MGTHGRVPDVLRPMTADQSQVVIRQLLAMREQLDATLLMLTGPQQDPAICPHPVDHRRVLPGGVMGGPVRYHCSACDEDFTEPARPALREA